MQPHLRKCFENIARVCSRAWGLASAPGYSAKENSYANPS